MHHDRTISTNQYGHEVDIAVLSTKSGEGHPETQAEVGLQVVSGGIHCHLGLTPAAALDLARRLMLAAQAAEPMFALKPMTPAPTLYAEPEAA